MNIEQLLSEKIAEALKALYGADVEASAIKLEGTKQDFAGDYTFVVFPFLKTSKKNPEQTATDIGGYLKEHCAEIADFNVIKGFLNLVISDVYWLKLFGTEMAGNKNFGQTQTGQGQKVMVEYSSPNTNKPLHLGHIRTNLLGFSVSRILQWNGYGVVKTNLVNDRGIHICKSMLAWQKFGNGETPESTGMKGDHLVGKYYVEFDKLYKKEIKELVAQGVDEETAKKTAPIIQEAQEMLRKWEADNPEIMALWNTMNRWVYDGFDKTYKRLGVDFDKFYYESNTYLLGKEIVQEGLDKGVFYRKDDGSVWIDLTADGLDQKLLLRSDGTSVYMTQDLGTAQRKYEEFHCDKSIYVVGNEQEYHFKVLFLIAKKLGWPYADGLFHLSYGMVELPEGKMKSREGTVVDADDLMQEMHDTAREITLELGKIEGFNEAEQDELFETIGIGALKYFLLKVDPFKRIVFNPKESIDFQGNTGPFIQYTHARIQSLLRNIKESGFEVSGQAPQKLHAEEKDLLVLLSTFPKLAEQAAREYNPSLIANYVYEIAKAYNRFYRELSVNKEPDAVIKSFRVKLSEATGHAIRNALWLLGINSPERM